MGELSRATEVWGCAEATDASLRLRVERVRPHSLIISFADREALPANGSHFDRLTLTYGDRQQALGPCIFERRPAHSRRSDDPPADGSDGRLSFLESVYDFRQLLRSGHIVDLGRKVEQLPLVWNRKSTIKPSFRDLASQLLYEMQVYRGVFDDLDRNLEGEPPVIRDQVQQVAVQTEYPAFKAFFDERLRMLETEIASYSKQEHEQHGFFFRKQLWDIILSSEFLARTNLKPRGYAGDSVMMRMIYENTFRGPTVFSKFMHRHPLESAAAVAVRNRRSLLTRAITEAHAQLPRTGYGERARVLSVACGPAFELRDVLRTPEDIHKYEFVLLDQDRLALEEAEQTIAHAVPVRSERAKVIFMRDSVRTMLRSEDLADRWGRFDLIYSMGLFDYLTRPVAKAVLARLYELVDRHGTLIIGNFHPQNPTRAYMEYWMDWVLYYRTEAELLELTTGLPGAVINLQFEPTRSQMFMTVRRS